MRFASSPPVHDSATASFALRAISVATTTCSIERPSSETMCGSSFAAMIARARSSTSGEAGLDGCEHFSVEVHFNPEQFGHDIARDVVCRRPEAAGDEHDVRPRECFAQRVADCFAIRHRDLPLHAQAKRKEFLREKCE